MLRLILLISVLCSFALSVVGQGVIQIERRQYNVKRSDKKDVVIYYYPYSQSNLDLRHFKSVNEDLGDRIPDNITITPPEEGKLATPSKSVYGIGYLGDPEDGHLVALFVDGYYSSNPSFFIDKNFNNDFTDDGAALLFNHRTKYKEVLFELPNAEKSTYSIRLYHPKAQEELFEDVNSTSSASGSNNNPGLAGDPDVYLTNEQNIQKIEKARQNSSPFTIRTALLVGAGRIEYEYIGKETGYPVTYERNHSAKGFGLTFNYGIKNLQIGIAANFENIYYWSSQKRIQVGEPFIITSYDLTFFGDTIWREDLISNVEEVANDDILPKNRVSLGLNLEYQFNISNMARLSPYGRLWYSRFLNDVFIPDRFEPESYVFGDMYSWEAGIMFDYDVAPSGAFMLFIGFHNPGFNPRGFFEYEASSVQRQSNFEAKIGLGYHVYFGR